MLNILNIIKQKENIKLQFEVVLPDNKILIQTAIAFSNSKGGDLIIGIDKDGVVEGIDRKNDMLLKEKILTTLFNNCFPHIIPEIFTVSIEDKFVLLIHFYPSMQKPHYYRSKGRQEGTYIRSGLINQLASSYELESFEMYKRGLSFELSTNFNIKFETNNFSLFSQHIIDKLDKEPDIELFEKLRLIKKDNDQYILTNLGILFCDLKKDIFSPTCISCIELLDGSDRELEIKDDLISSIEKVMNFFKASSFLDGSNDSLFLLIKEIFINAIIHRDYLIKDDKIKIEISNSHIEICSPGSFGIDKGIIGQGICSSKNPNLHKILSFFGFAMDEEVGFNKIKFYLKNVSNIQILIGEFDNYVKFKVYKGQVCDPKDGEQDLLDLIYDPNNDPNTILKVPKNNGSDPKYLASDPNVRMGVPKDRFDTIVSTMSENCSVSSRKLAELIGVSEKTIKRDIEKMKQNGIIRRIGEKRNGYWEVIG